MGVVAVEWRGREGKEIGGGAQEEGTEREGRREWWGGEGKEEGRGGRGWGGGRKGLREGVRWVVLWGSSSPCLSACLWGSEGGNCPLRPRISVPRERPGVGHKEATCVGLSRVVAAQ